MECATAAAARVICVCRSVCSSTNGLAGSSHAAAACVVVQLLLPGVLRRRGPSRELTTRAMELRAAAQLSWLRFKGLGPSSSAVFPAA